MNASSENYSHIYKNHTILINMVNMEQRVSGYCQMHNKSCTKLCIIKCKRQYKYRLQYIVKIMYYILLEVCYVSNISSSDSVSLSVFNIGFFNLFVLVTLLFKVVTGLDLDPFGMICRKTKALNIYTFLA